MSCARCASFNAATSSAPGARNPVGSVAEIRRYLALGLDAFFTDDPALGLAARDAH